MIGAGPPCHVAWLQSGTRGEGIGGRYFRPHPRTAGRGRLGFFADKTQIFSSISLQLAMAVAGQAGAIRLVKENRSANPAGGTDSLWKISSVTWI